jgi:hypothetical protein
MSYDDLSQAGLLTIADARHESGCVPMLLAQLAHTPATHQHPKASVSEHRPTAAGELRHDSRG